MTLFFCDAPESFSAAVGSWGPRDSKNKHCGASAFDCVGFWTVIPHNEPRNPRSKLHYAQATLCLSSPRIWGISNLQRTVERQSRKPSTRVLRSTLISGLQITTVFVNTELLPCSAVLTFAVAPSPPSLDSR